MRKSDDKRTSETVLVAARAAHAAPTADNLQPLAVRTLDNALILQYRAPGGPTFPARHPATLMGVGAALENVVQAAAAMEVGVNIEVVAGAGNDYARIDLAQTGSPTAARAMGHALFTRHTNRHAYAKTPVADTTLAQVAGLRDDAARIHLIRQADEVRALAGLTEAASRVRFRTAEIHAWFAASLRLTPEEAAHGDGLDVRTFDLPPGGMALLRYIAPWHRLERLNRIGAYRLLAAIEGAPIGKAPLLVAIIADDSLSAGRLMQRAWIQLNAQGLAVQPYYVIPDQIQRLHAGTVPEVRPLD